MWLLKTINYPDLNVGSGSKICFHNWTDGRNINGKRVLTPSQVVELAALKCTDTADPHFPQGEKRLFGVMIGAHSAGDFAQKLQQLSAMLPLAELKQAADYARASQNHEQHKMQIMRAPRAPFFTPQAPLNPLKMGKQGAQAGDSEDVFSKLAKLKQAKAQAEAEAAQALEALQQLNLDAYVFDERGELLYLADKLKQDPPPERWLYTMAIFFIL